MRWFNMMKKVLLALLSVVSLGLAANHSNHSNNSKHSDRPCLDPASTVDWNFIVDTFDIKGGCTCDKPFPKVGLKIQVAEPIAFIETPNKAWNFICLGNTRSKFSFEKGDGTNLGKTGAKTNVHYIEYPFFKLMGLGLDLFCGTDSSMVSSIAIIPAGLSEVNPFLWDDALSILAQPWKILLATPLLQATCLADCAAASAVSPTSKGVDKYETLRNSLFYCAGCWGEILPDTTTTLGQDSLVESALTATKELDLLSEVDLLKDYQTTRGLAFVYKIIHSRYPVPSKVYCQPKYFPAIVKSQYWLNLSYPKFEHAIPIGEFPPKWASFKKAFNGGQDVWTVWRIRTCCFGL